MNEMICSRTESWNQFDGFEGKAGDKNSIPISIVYRDGQYSQFNVAKVMLLTTFCSWQRYVGDLIGHNLWLVQFYNDPGKIIQFMILI